MKAKNLAIVMGVFGLSAFVFSVDASAMGRRRPAPPPVVDEKITLGEIAVNGTGCPAGTSQVTVTEDGSAVRILLTGFTAESAGSLVRKACSIAIPVQDIPAGKKLVVTDSMVLGEFALSAAATGKVTLETFSAGSTGDVAEKTLDAMLQGESGSLELAQHDIAVTACGQSGLVRVNTSARLKATDASFIRLASAELALKLVPCEQ